MNGGVRNWLSFYIKFLITCIRAFTYFQTLGASLNKSACTLMRGDTVLDVRGEQYEIFVFASHKSCHHALKILNTV